MGEDKLSTTEPSVTNWKAFIGYGSGDFGLNLFWQGTGFYLFFFYANVAGLQASVIGAIFLIAGIWDAVSDPLLGYIAERTRTKWGPYRPYLLFGAVPLSASFYLLFLPVEIESQFWQAVYYLFILLLFRSCYTIVSIPYAALGARVTRNSDQRTKLAGIRMYFGFLGGICISFFAKYMQETYPDDVAFTYMATGAAVVSSFFLYLCFVSTKESANPINEMEVRAAPGKCFHAVLNNRPFLVLMGGITLVTVANTVVGQTILFYFESQFADRGAGNTAIIIMTVAPLLSIPLWACVALKFGKRNAWVLGGLLSLIGFVLLYSDISGSKLFALIEITIVTLGLSSYAVIFWSMLPDTIEYGGLRNNVHGESLLMGVASSFQKMSIGLSAFALGALLDAIGFDAKEVASDAVSQGIKNIFILIPGIALIGSTVLIFLYPITAKLHGKIVANLQRKAR